MRREYVTPKVTCEAFAPNEYIAACAEAFDKRGVYFVPCRGSTNAKKHGFIVDATDLGYINLFKEGYDNDFENKQFDVNYCGYPGCSENDNQHTDRKMKDADNVSFSARKDYQWANIDYMWKSNDDTALFNDGEFMPYNAS